MEENLVKAVRYILVAIALVGVLVAFGATSSYASNNASVTQVINPGTLTTDIRDASRVAVPSPVFAMTAAPFSFNCQTSTGTIGSSTQRIYIDNPSGANNGWTLTVAATAGATSLWNNTGSTQGFDFNDPTTAGCADGADADLKGGQLTLNAAAGTLTADCASCSLTSITKGTSAGFNQGTLDSVTLLNAAAASDDVGRWYLTGITSSQTVPAEQPADSYSFGLTATVTAS
jgi:hypothetical protein